MEKLSHPALDILRATVRSRFRKWWLDESLSQFLAIGRDSMVFMVDTDEGPMAVKFYVNEGVLLDPVQGGYLLRMYGDVTNYAAYNHLVTGICRGHNYSIEVARMEALFWSVKEECHVSVSPLIDGHNLGVDAADPRIVARMKQEAEVLVNRVAESYGTTGLKVVEQNLKWQADPVARKVKLIITDMAPAIASLKLAS